MCDTLLLLRPHETWLAKNSDREPDEPQRVEWHPAGKSADGRRQATYLSVEAPRQRYASWLSRPDWMWGAEMGVNEKGVAIGNEAVFTHLINRKTNGLLGMDLLRLALEQSASADDALQIITTYLEKYGQGGAAGFQDKKMFYDNSFLVADAQLAWQLETAGRYWVAKKYSWENGDTHAAISNSLSISSEFDQASDQIEDKCRAAGFWNGKGDFDFKSVFSTRLMPWAARVSQRQQCNLRSLSAVADNMPVAGQIAVALSQHNNARGHSSNADVCMHARGKLRPSQTTQSMISRLGADNSRVWVTGGSAPCVSLFKPLFQPVPGRGAGPRLVQADNFWEQWQQVYLKTESSAEFRSRVQVTNQRYQPSLWQADSETAEQQLMEWWQAIQSI